MFNVFEYNWEAIKLIDSINILFHTKMSELCTNFIHFIRSMIFLGFPKITTSKRKKIIKKPYINYA